MFGTKIRNWMEAQIARSRSKKKERLKQQQSNVAVTSTASNSTTLQTCPAFFDTANFDELNESPHPSLPLSGSSFKPNLQPQRRAFVPDHQQTHLRHHRQYHEQHKPGQADKPRVTQQQPGRVSTVNLSSPESAYSTGYSTDGTSPCPATYAPDCYLNSRGGQLHQQRRHQNQQQLTRVQDEQQRIDARRPGQQHWQQSASTNVENNGTYSITGRREYLLQQQQQPWRKPAPPTPIRTSSATNSPKIQPQQHQPNASRNSDSSVISNYPMQLFSPRRLPLVSNTSIQVRPMSSPRQCSWLAQHRTTNPWQSARSTRTVVAPSPPAAYRAWGDARLQPQNQRRKQHQKLQKQFHPTSEYSCCSRRESLSVGRSPVNLGETDWRYSRREPSNGVSIVDRGARCSRSSSASSACSSRSRSCSIGSTSSQSSRPSRNSSGSSGSSSSSSSSAGVLPTSPSSDEMMGKFDDNYLSEKDRNPKRRGRNSNRDNNTSFSAKLSDASASSLELWRTAGAGKKSARSSRSSSRQRRDNVVASTFRRPGQRESSCERSSRLPSRAGGRDNNDEDSDVEEEGNPRHRKSEAELLQEILTRRLKRTANHSEAAAQMNRALLERLLMKNANSCADYRLEKKRAWSANTPARILPAASLSVGGTPICLRKKPLKTGQLVTQSSRFGRNGQIYPFESTSSLKDMTTSELALMKADREVDLKYAQLLMETERVLLSARRQLLRAEVNSGIRASSSLASTADNSPFRKPLTNKRLELIRNGELTPLRNQNSQPELSSGSIRDLLEHSSPKRLLQMQQKRMIAPAVTHAVASTQTTVKDYSTYKSLHAKPMAHQSRGLNTASEQYSCPQSEPLRRKVYQGQRHFCHPVSIATHELSNSDDDFTNDQHDQHCQQVASGTASESQLRKRVIIETLQGLKQSLQNQSAALKRGCLQPP